MSGPAASASARSGDESPARCAANWRVGPKGLHEMGGAEQERADTAASSRQPNLTAQTASGLRWFYLSTMVLMVANLAYTATVSRLLDPVAFGLMAMANLVVLFTQYFASMGLAPALVQKPDLSRDEIRASSTAGIAIGLACLAVVW